jgi:hydrogenase maturation protein HypF
MELAETYHIHLKGIVQGVGFRPMARQFASRHGIHGMVCNSADGLHMEWNLRSSEFDSMMELFINEAPPLARILSVKSRKIEFCPYDNFEIRESLSGRDQMNSHRDLPLTPDFAICPECRSDINEAGNRRFRYPFATCSVCGPRYSITRDLPFDRVNTVMESFKMCYDCSREYEDINDRRYFSQTNSCDNCGIHLCLVSEDGSRITKGNEDSLMAAVNLLRKGAIIAVKGIGGYLLLCDAANSSSVCELRKRKKRPTKPLALLCKNLEASKEIAFCSQEEENWLVSVIAPIVLLKAKKEAGLRIALDEIAPGLSTIGIMLPCAPLLQLIADDFGEPLVATSGNISGAAIVHRDKDALTYLCKISDHILMHDRDILLPQDDSVIRICPASKRAIILRRSRGLAPSFFDYAFKHSGDLFAAGALMKSSFGILQSNQLFVSQYLGNTKGLEAQESYQEVSDHLIKITGAHPKIIVIDKHPGYFSSSYGRELAENWSADLIEVQHHRAHFAAVLEENQLLDCAEPVLGVIWDGTGLGEDGRIWGSEFFEFEGGEMKRITHLNYYPWILADKMAREPRISALALCRGLEGVGDLIENKFSASEWKLYRGLIERGDYIETSSMGRVFDAVASLLGLCDKQTYEGEASSYLERIAADYIYNHGLSADLMGHTDCSISAMPDSIIRSLQKGQERGFIAARFHMTLVYWVSEVASRSGVRKIAFSGGVFQNALLVDLIQECLCQDYELYFHRNLPPNDENISFGQLVYVDRGIRVEQGLENIRSLNPFY